MWPSWASSMAGRGRASTSGPMVRSGKGLALFSTPSETSLPLHLVPFMVPASSKVGSTLKLIQMGRCSTSSVSTMRLW